MEFEPQIPCGEKRHLALAICPLTSTHGAHACAQTRTRTKYIKKMAGLVNLKETLTVWGICGPG